MKKMDTCKECGKEFDDLIEFIDKGIKHAIFCNKKDQITKEVTEYTKEGIWLCEDCYEKRLDNSGVKLRQNPQDLGAWHDKIGSLMELHSRNNEEIIKTYDEMLVANPTHSEALIGKAHWLELVMQKPQEALKCFEKALEIEPSNEEAIKGTKRLS